MHPGCDERSTLHQTAPRRCCPVVPQAPLVCHCFGGDVGRRRNRPRRRVQQQQQQRQDHHSRHLSTRTVNAAEQGGVGVARGDFVSCGKHVCKPCWVLSLAFGGLPENLTHVQIRTARAEHQFDNVQALCQAPGCFPPKAQGPENLGPPHTELEHRSRRRKGKKWHRLEPRSRGEI